MLLKNLRPLLLLISGTRAAIGDCYEPGPSFPIPRVTTSLFESSQLSKKFDLTISNALNSHPSKWSPQNSSFAIQLTSSSETLWSSYYTAPNLGNYTDGEPTAVTGDTAFRIASCSKTFTVYALLLENGIGLEDPITKFLPELKGERKKEWGMPVDWDRITIRSLASQLSGIGRGIGNPDLAVGHFDEFDPTSVGLPTITHNDIFLKPCMAGWDGRPCTGKDTIEIAKSMHPIFSPNDRSSYSNIGFSLLGLVLENVTGQTFTEVIQSSILNPLNMTKTVTTKPNDAQGIIPVGETDWDHALGPDIPTGGIYTTTNDLSKYLRSILTSALLPKSVTNAWMKPHSWTSTRTNSAYGMPWEIYRTTKATPDSHPVDIITKGGSLRGYYSNIALLPEYGVGLTILTATPDQPVLFELQELILSELIPSLDSLVRNITREKYQGLYTSSSSSKINSSISISIDPNGPGLLLDSWILNSTNFLPAYGLLKRMPSGPDAWEARLIPTNVNSPMTAEVEGETTTWRLTAIPKDKGDGTSLFADYCFTDVDGLIYGGWSLEEFVFDGRMGMERVFISGARTLLGKVGKGEGLGVVGGAGKAEQVVLGDGEL